MHNSTPGASALPRHRQAWVCRAYGGPEHLALVQQPLAPPGRRQLLVQVDATTVESADVRIRSLTLPRGYGLVGRLVFGWRRPRQPVLGAVLAGTVVAVGPDVPGWAVGDAIVATTGAGGGAHASLALVCTGRPIVRRPPGLSAAQAVAVVFGGHTALHFLDRAALQPGAQLLVIGATGAVGSALVQLAHARGATVTALASAANLALARQLGARQALDYRQHSLASLGSGTGGDTDAGTDGGRFDTVADTCAASSFGACLPLLRPGGRYLNIAGDLPSLLAPPRRGRRSIGGPAAESTALLQRVLDLAAAGSLVPVIDSTWPFADLPAAHARAGSGHKRGSVVVQVA
jgi:NADPH:quinone reductase-like Zn-dependent oxidoreductase